MTKDIIGYLGFWVIIILIVFILLWWKIKEEACKKFFLEKGFKLVQKKFFPYRRLLKQLFPNMNIESPILFKNENQSVLYLLTLNSDSDEGSVVFSLAFIHFRIKRELNDCYLLRNNMINRYYLKKRITEPFFEKFRSERGFLITTQKWIGFCNKNFLNSPISLILNEEIEGIITYKNNLIFWTSGYKLKKIYRIAKLIS